MSRGKALIIIILFLAGLTSGYYLLQDNETTFPVFPAGYYVGTISGLAPQPQKERSFLVIKEDAQPHSLMMVVFAKHWKPQITSLEGLEDETSLPPISVSYLKQAYKLTGTIEKDSSLSGSIRINRKRVGSWKLSPKTKESLLSKHALEKSGSNISKWLKVKGRYYSLQEQDTQIKKEISAYDSEIIKLKEALVKKETLASRAQQQIDTLETRIEQKFKEQRQIASELEIKAKNLQQLTRIKSEGRAIELARRVSKRESKWYEVNWGDSRNEEQTEESIARDMGIDLGRMQSQLSRSEEYLRLKNIISYEKRKINELQRFSVEDTLKKKPKEKPLKPRDSERKPWWDKLDGIFG